MRQSKQEVPFGLKPCRKLRDKGRKVELRRYLYAHLRQHVPHETAFFKRHVFYYALIPIAALGVDNVGPGVAVAADGMAVAARGELHYKSQRFEAVFPFFEKIAVYDELVALGEIDLFEKPSEIGHIRVYIRNGDDAPCARIESLDARVNVPH